MDDLTLNTIYAIKHNCNGDSYDEIIKNLMSEYSGTDPNFIGEYSLTTFATRVALDYADTADNPRFFLWELFENMRFDCKRLYPGTESFDYRVRNAIWSTLAGLQVKENGEYINGFREAI